MFVTSPLPIQTKKIIHSIFAVHLFPPLWKRFRRPWLHFLSSTFADVYCH